MSSAIPSNVGQRIGATINVSLDADLDNLDPSGLTIGSQVYSLQSKEQWTLTASTASVGAGVRPVLGNSTGLRWLISEITGDVTLAQLAATGVTSGATLIGVNNPAARYDQASLQAILDSDVIVKVDLAASDGTGGTSLVATQNTGAYYSNTKALEAFLQAGGAKDVTQDASIATNAAAVALRQTIASPSPATLTNGQVAETDLVATSTNALETILKLTRDSSGTPANGEGLAIDLHLADTGHVLRRAARFYGIWSAIGAAYANCSSKVRVAGVQAGTEADFAEFNNQQSLLQLGGAAAPGISFMGVPSWGFYAGGGIMGAAVNTVPIIQMATVGNSSAGAAEIGFLGATAVIAPSLGASLTNNVALTGTANTLPDFTNGTVYSTDYANLHATISQLAAKVAKLELLLKGNGLGVT